MGLVAPPGIEPIPPAVEVWSLNYWVAREVPWLPFRAHLPVPSLASLLQPLLRALPALPVTQDCYCLEDSPPRGSGSSFPWVFVQKLSHRAPSLITLPEAAPSPPGTITFEPLTWLLLTVPVTNHSKQRFSVLFTTVLFLPAPRQVFGKQEFKKYLLNNHLRLILNYMCNSVKSDKWIKFLDNTPPLSLLTCLTYESIQNLISVIWVTNERCNIVSPIYKASVWCTLII